MSRWLKVLLGVLGVLVVLLVLNAIVLDRQTKDAEVTVEGAEIVRLPGGDLQVLDTGPVVRDVVVPPSGMPPAQPAPIVLLNCFTCSINWWRELIPALEEAGHRVIAIDLLGHGGSEMPGSGYELLEQGRLIAEALGRLDVASPIVVGHSLGGAVAVAVAEESPDLVGGVGIVDTEPDTSYGSLSLTARAVSTPVIGEGLWRVKVDWSVRKGLEEAFAPGFEVPDQFVEDVERMTYTAYDDSHSAFDSYVDESPLDQRLTALGKPLLVIFGAEEQIVDDPRKALSAYAAVDGAQTALVQEAGHSPNVEKPVETAALINRFAGSVAAEQAGSATASAPQPSPSRTCARRSRSGRESGARRGGGQEEPRPLPARCRNGRSSPAPQSQSR
jgi:pimeloyl-ACP methyl ester carboxylesterase